MSDGAVLYVIQHYEQDLRRAGLPPGLTDEERALFEVPEWTSHHKIGIASDVNRRLSSLRGGTPHRLRLVSTVNVDGDTEAAEQALHELYDVVHYRGEWFTLHQSDIDSFKRLTSITPEEINQVRERVSGLGAWPLETSLYNEVMRVRGGRVVES